MIEGKLSFIRLPRGGYVLCDANRSMDLETCLATGTLDSAARQPMGPDTAAKLRMSSSLSSFLIGIRPWIYALIDQAMVSGSRFLATIIVGRVCGPGELGTYSLAVSLLVLAACFQEAMITTPYAVLSQRLRPRPKASYSRGLFGCISGSRRKCSPAVSALALVGFVLHAQLLGIVALVLALTLPSSLTADFARRFAPANHNVQQAMRIDATIAGCN